MRFDGEAVPAIAALDVRDVRRHRAQPRDLLRHVFEDRVPRLARRLDLRGERFVGKIVLTKQAGDLHSSTLNQMAVHRVVSDGSTRTCRR